MAEEIEEIPPYEEWTVKDLKAELSARNLNNAGKKPELVERLYMNDEFDGVEDEGESEPEEVEESHEDGLSGDAVVISTTDQGWVDGNYFYAEFVEDIGNDDFNKLPTTETHHRLLAESFQLAVNSSNLEVVGGPFDGSLASKILMGGKVTYKYRVTLRRNR